MTIKTQIKEICTGDQNLKAKANLLFEGTFLVNDTQVNGSFLIRDYRIVEGKSGLFVSPPARRVDEKFVDICFPRNIELREEMKTLILDEYLRTVEKTETKADIPAAPETPADETVSEQETFGGGENAAESEISAEDETAVQDGETDAEVNAPAKRKTKKKVDDADDAA